MSKKITVYVKTASDVAANGVLSATPEIPRPQDSALTEESTESALALEPPPRMLEVLPRKFMETRPPLMYRLINESDATKTYARIAKSRIYRANAFSCGFFYKPISRCLIEWED